ncbi:MAG TPA: hypothetical protein VLW17_11230, partial [Thermoanaerobaculaceae bacterium]|nr:hypothetical protein [Thermoanaerobaculaceae bacterium]
PVLNLLGRMAIEPPPDTDVFSVVSAVPVSVRDAYRFFAMGRPTWLSWLGTRAVLESLASAGDPHEQRLADAVVVAGAEMAASNCRRAVVVITATAPGGDGNAKALADRSAVTVAAARAYLAALDVPLVVWSFAKPPSGVGMSPWPAPEDVSSGSKLQLAQRKLVSQLSQQRIVWLAGRHLPQRIAIDGSRTDLRLAR